MCEEGVLDDPHQGADTVLVADHVIDMEGQGVHEVVLSLQKLLPTLGAPRESTD